MTHHRTISKIVVAMLISTLSVGCGDSTGPAPSAEGTYALRSLDGKAVPVVMYEDSEVKLELTSGSLNLTTAGVCSATVSFRLTDKTSSVAMSEAETSSCHFVISGSTITVTDDEDSTKTTGTISGGRITVTEDNVWVYSK